VPFFVPPQGDVCFFGKKRKYCLEAGRHVLLSFACPKESNQRTEALKGRAHEHSEQKESGKDNRVCF